MQHLREAGLVVVVPHSELSGGAENRGEADVVYFDFFVHVPFQQRVLMDFLAVTESQHPLFPADPKRTRFFFGQNAGSVAAGQMHAVS